MHKLTYACVLTRDIDRLGRFYRAVLQLEPSSRSGYMEFPTEPGIFSLWSLDEFGQIVGAGAADQVAQGNIMLEFRVDVVWSRKYASTRTPPESFTRGLSVTSASPYAAPTL